MAKDENDLVVFEGKMLLNIKNKKKTEKISIPTSGCVNLKRFYFSPEMTFLSMNLVFSKSSIKARTKSALGLSV
jgi:hypothetical protein